MKKTIIAVLLGAFIVALSYVVLERIWTWRGQLLLSLGFSTLAIGLLLWVHRSFFPAAATGTLPAGIQAADSGLRRSASAFSIALAVGGSILVYASFKAMMAGQWGNYLGFIVLAALAWRPVLSREDGKAGRGTVAALLLILVAASALRLHKAGDIPAGLATTDESRIMIKAHEIYDGARPTFVTGLGVADGALPFYLQALSMKVFGDSVKGFRMEGNLIGVLLVLLVAWLAWLIDGPRLSVFSSAFMALSFWPHTVSRAQYLMNETHLVVLLLFIFLLLGLKKDNSLYFAGAGVMFAMCFNSYKAAQICLVLVPLLFAMVWIWQPQYRAALRRGIYPFVGTALISLAPLLLWAKSNPAAAFRDYFSSLYGTHVVGANINPNLGFIGRMDLVLGRVMPNFNRVQAIFTNHGPMLPWYFAPDQPILQKTGLFFFIAGVATCLVRFRNVPFAFLLIWWAAGLVPGIVTEIATIYDERRIMMSMMPMMLISAAGMQSMFGVLVAPLRRAHGQKIIALAAAGVFVALGWQTWTGYFGKLNSDNRFLEWNRANIANFARAIYEEDKKGPVYLVSTRRMNEDDIAGPNDSPFRLEVDAIAYKVARLYIAGDSNYLREGGLVSTIRQTSWKEPRADGRPRELLVALTPFHFYLEPLLVNVLGGKLVREVPVVKGSSGMVTADIGMAFDPEITTKLIRFNGFKVASLDALPRRWYYPSDIEELSPPGQVGSRDYLLAVNVTSAEMQKVLRNYADKPSGWSASKKGRYEVVDPYFWTTTGKLPFANAPLRTRSTWWLKIPADGEYRIGASSTVFTSIKVGGKKALEFIPYSDPKVLVREGVFGQPLQLKKGIHKIEIEQLLISSVGNYNFMFRLIWQTPGGNKETVPLANLFPAESDAINSGN